MTNCKGWKWLMPKMEMVERQGKKFPKIAWKYVTNHTTEKPHLFYIYHSKLRQVSDNRPDNRPDNRKTTDPTTEKHKQEEREWKQQKEWKRNIRKSKRKKSTSRKVSWCRRKTITVRNNINDGSEQGKKQTNNDTKNICKQSTKEVIPEKENRICSKNRRWNTKRPLGK